MHKIKTMQDLGTAVRRARNAQELTQLELAEACGVGITFISQLERGKETAEIGKVLRVTQMLGLDLFVAKRGE